MSDVLKVAEQIQKWADDGGRPDEWLLKEWAARLRLVPAEVGTTRNDVLEEAAKVAEEATMPWDIAPPNVAELIRALKVNV